MVGKKKTNKHGGADDSQPVITREGGGKLKKSQVGGIKSEAMSKKKFSLHYF